MTIAARSLSHGECDLLKQGDAGCEKLGVRLPFSLAGAQYGMTFCVMGMNLGLPLLKETIGDGLSDQQAL